MGWLCFSPVTSRVSPRRASYFFLRRQKKVTKKKASHVRALRVPCATRKMEHPRSGFAASPSRGRHQRPGKAGSAVSLVGAALRLPRTRGSFAALTSRGVGLPHSSRLTAHKGTARRATTTDPLIPHPSPLIMGNHKGCPYALTPTTSLLHPHPSLLHPHPSPLTPHPSPLTPHPSPLTPHPSPLTPHSSLLTPHSSLLTPHPSPLTPHSSLLTPHSSLLTPHSSLLTPHPSHTLTYRIARFFYH